MNHQSGMSLLESLVAVALTALGFMGLQAFYGVAQKSIAASSARVQANIVAEQIVEDIASDMPSIAAIGNVNLGNCGAISSQKHRDWCDRLNRHVGTANSNALANNSEFRRVNVTRVPGTANAWMITVEIATQGGKSHIVVRRRVSQ